MRGPRELPGVVSQAGRSRARLTAQTCLPFFQGMKRYFPSSWGACRGETAGAGSPGVAHPAGA